MFEMTDFAEKSPTTNASKAGEQPTADSGAQNDFEPNSGLLSLNHEQLSKLWNQKVDQMIEQGVIPGPQQSPATLGTLNVPILAGAGGNAIYTASEQLSELRNPVKIIHVPQIHYPTILNPNEQPRELFSDELDRVATSQHQIALYLKNNPDLVVLGEGQNIALTKEHLQQCYRMLPEVPNTTKEQRAWLASADDQNVALGAINLSRTLSKFPGGIPEDFSELTCDQKLLLAVAGGDVVSFFLQETKAIYPTISPENEKTIGDGLTAIAKEYDYNRNIVNEDPRFRALAIDVRERSAQVEVQALIQDPTRYCEGDRIAIIYGAAHNFSDEFKAEAGFDFEIAEGFKEAHNPRPNPLVQHQQQVLESLEKSFSQLGIGAVVAEGQNRGLK